MGINNKNVDRAYEILKLYLDNNYPDEVEKEVMDWLVAEFDNPDKLMAMKWIFFEYIHPDHNPNSKALKMYNKMAERLGFAKVKRKTLHRRIILKIAAVIIPLVLIAGGMLWYTINSGCYSDVLAEVNVSANESSHKKILLPDSTEVWLRSGSEIAYKEYSDKREVQLSGEGYFIVAKENRPFTVDANHISVEVLGTEFNLSSVSGNENVSVILYSGSIRTTVDNKDYILSPGEHLRYNYKTSDISVGRDSSLSSSEWVDKALSFENCTLPDIFKQCEDYFGVSIVADKQISSGLHHSVKFKKEDTLKEVLDVLQILTKEFQYKIENDTVKIIIQKP